MANTKKRAAENPPNDGESGKKTANQLPEENGSAFEEESAVDENVSQDRTIDDVLCQYNLDIYRRLTPGQCCTLVKKLVQSEQAREYRPSEVQAEIDEHHRRENADLHPQEYNEIACSLDYIFKLKANIDGLAHLLEQGDSKVCILSLPDSDFENDCETVDVFTFIPPQLTMEICQGTAKQHFGDYKQYNGSPKNFEGDRYMVGLFSGRVYDTEADKAYTDGDLLRELPTLCMRQMEGSARKDDDDGTSRWNVSFIDSRTGKKFQLKLHRLIQGLASHLEISVFNNGKLEELGIHFPKGRTWDNTFAYRSISRNIHENDRIMRALRVGDEHSKQCDCDHRLGYEYAHCHALGHCQATSHRMNACFNYVRGNAGHWCFGLFFSKYTGGYETNEPDLSFLNRVRVDGDQAFFDEEPIQDTQLCELLPKHDGL